MMSRLLAGILFLVSVVASVANAGILYGPVINPSNGRAYYLLEADTWQGSAAQANTLGGHLVVINDQTENDWVAATFGRFGGVSRNLWIGLSDAAKEGTFEWMTREPLTFTAWKSGKPNNSQEGANYAFIHAPGEEGVTGVSSWGNTLNTGDGGQIAFHGVVEADHLENDNLAFEKSYLAYEEAYHAVSWTIWPDFAVPPKEEQPNLRFWRKFAAGANARLNLGSEPNGSPSLQPFELVFEPAVDSSVSASWSSPMAGTFSVEVSFTDIDDTGDGQDVHVLIGGVEVFSSTVNAAEGKRRVTYTSPAPVQLKRGQSVSVQVGYGGAGHDAVGDATRVDASVRYVNTDATYFEGTSGRLRLNDAGNVVLNLGTSDLTYDADGSLISKEPAVPVDSIKSDYVQVTNGKVRKYRGSDDRLLWETPLDAGYSPTSWFKLDSLGDILLPWFKLDSQGNVLLPVRKITEGSPYSTFHLIKYAAENGQQQWVTDANATPGSFTNIATDKNNDIVSVDIDMFGAPTVTKLSGASGQSLWNKSISPLGEQLYLIIHYYPDKRNVWVYNPKLLFDSDNNPILFGSVNAAIIMGEEDAYAVKLEADTGKELWQRMWRAPDDNRYWGALLNSQGDLILAQQGSFIRYKAPPIDDQYVTFRGHTEAMLHARVRVSDPQAKVYAEYGTDSSYGMRTSEVPVPADGPVSVLLGEITAPNVYHYRFVAQTAQGMVVGEDQVFDMVQAPNLAPVAQADAYEDPAPAGASEFIIDVLANDSDPDGDQLRITSVSQGRYGTISTDGAKITYKPAAGFAFERFTYYISDAYGGTSSSTVDVKRSGLALPVAVDDAVQTPASASVVINVLANDENGGNPLTIYAVNQPSHGYVGGASGGRLIYYPNQGFEGEDRFTYAVSNGVAISSLATVRVKVIPNNLAPVAVDDAVKVSSAVDIDVLANDTDPEGAILKVTGATQPAHGTVDTSMGVRLRYTPTPGYLGEDQFTYTISDGSRTAQAVVRVTVQVNQAPTALDDLVQLEANSGRTINVFANDRDPEGQPLRLYAYTVPSHGELHISVTEGIGIYIPYPDFVGEDQFTYTITDGALTAQATVRITVIGVGELSTNQPPIAVDDLATLSSGMVELDVLANDRDPEGKRLMIAGFTQPVHGSVSATTGGKLRYSSFSGFNGEDQFTYTISDGALTAQATVRVAANPWFGESTILTSSGAMVPGAGESEGVPAGAKFRSFGLSSINDREEVAFTATFAAGKESGSAVFAGSPLQLIARKGAPVPDADGQPLPKGEVFRSFLDPLLNARGDVAFLARISGCTQRSDSGLWLKPADGILQMVLREGEAAAGINGAKWSAFTSVGLTDSGAIPFVARLQVGKGGVTQVNALGLWIKTASETSLLLRQGDWINVGGTRKQVRTFAALTPAEGSPGHGRVGTGEEVLARVSWSDRTQSLVKVAPGVAPEIVASTGDLVTGSETKFASFGIPSMDKQGRFAVKATLRQGAGGVTSRNDLGIFTYVPDVGWKAVVRKGDGGGYWGNKLGDPVQNDEGITAFASNSRGVLDEEIWRTGPYGLVGASGSDENTGLSPHSVVSLALPDGQESHVYLAKMGASAEGRPVASTSRIGLWAVNWASLNHLLCYEGQTGTVNGIAKTVRALDTLRVVPGSPAQPRSYNSKGQIIYRATFTDGTQAILQHQLP